MRDIQCIDCKSYDEDEEGHGYCTYHGMDVRWDTEKCDGFSTNGGR